MKIVNGLHRGSIAEMLRIDEKSFSATVKLKDVSDYCLFMFVFIWNFFLYSKYRYVLLRNDNVTIRLVPYENIILHNECKQIYSSGICVISE